MQTSFYFAHPTSMYHSVAERDIAARFREAVPGAEVENPNQKHHSEGYQREGMDYFLSVCDRQDGVFFAPHFDGSIGAGVAKEVDSFLKRGAPVFYFDPGQLAFQSLSGPHALAGFLVRDVDSTRTLLQAERALKSAGADPYRDLETYGRFARS